MARAAPAVRASESTSKSKSKTKTKAKAGVVVVLEGGKRLVERFVVLVVVFVFVFLLSQRRLVRLIGFFGDGVERWFGFRRVGHVGFVRWNRRVIGFRL